MKKIDAHAHVFDHIASFGKAGELRPLGNGKCRWATGEEFPIIPEGYGDKEFLVESLLKVMDANDVEKAILLQGVLYGLQNEYVMECVEKYPERFKGAVMLDPFCRCRDQILDRFINEFGAKIFKFEVSVGGGMSGYHSDFILDGQVMGPVIERISGVDKSVLVLDIGSPSMTSCQPEAVARIAEAHPEMHIVVCHLLAPSLSDGPALERALPYLRHENVWVDLSALPWNVAPEAYPYPTAIDYIKMAKDVLGADKLIWGTDAPCVMTKFDYKDLYTFLEDSDAFADEEKKAIFYGNAVDAYYL